MFSTVFWNDFSTLSLTDKVMIRILKTDFNPARSVHNIDPVAYLNFKYVM